MTEKEIKEVLDFLYDKNNEMSCENCPYNEGNFTNAKLPCGQQNCWVTCHCEDN